MQEEEEGVVRGSNLRRAEADINIRDLDIRDIDIRIERNVSCHLSGQCEYFSGK